MGKDVAAKLLNEGWKPNGKEAAEIGNLLYKLKVERCMPVCLFVPKDLANRLTYRVLLNRVPSHRSQEGL